VGIFIQRKMTFVKVQKGKAYFKRFQTKLRRRQEGKTDYYARTRMIRQTKDKYNTPKYRLVVRFTNTRVICQVIYATLAGDKVLAAADSRELSKYGLTVGLKNYPAAYCTGLLVGRRVLQKLGLGDTYTGVGNEEGDEVTGEIVKVEMGKRTYFVDELDEKRPFRCFLDIGLKRTSIGAKVFGALKGAVDAGLDIPHNEKKLIGYDKDEKKYDADAHRDAIYGANIQQWMEQLIEDDQESGTNRFKKLFGEYEKAGVGPDDLEELYKKVHAAIRKDPTPKYKETAKERASKRKHTKKFAHPTRKTKEQRDKDIAVKLAAFRAKEGDAEEVNEDEE
jgi:large subunit ribosomal protein L5e